MHNQAEISNKVVLINNFFSNWQPNDTVVRHGWMQAWQVSGLEERVMEDSITFGEAQDLDPTSDFNFSCEGQIMPELKWLQPYRDLEVCCFTRADWGAGPASDCELEL